MKHYVYRITNNKHHKHYYGTRSALNPSEDIGVKYFSSSKDKAFIKDQKENPQHYKYKVIKVYNTRVEAIQLEIKLHARFDVGVNESFYNRAKQTSVGFDTTGLKGDLCGRTGYKASDETKEKIRKAVLGKRLTEEEKQAQRGWKHTQEAKDNISKNHRGISGKDNPSAKLFKFISPQGQEHIVRDGGKKWCEKMSLSWAMFVKYPNQVIKDSNNPCATEKTENTYGWCRMEIKNL